MAEYDVTLETVLSSRVCSICQTRPTGGAPVVWWHDWGFGLCVECLARYGVAAQGEMFEGQVYRVLKESQSQPETDEQYRKKPISDKLRRKVIERDGFVCRYCGEAVDRPNLDHIVPESRGGETSLDNLAVACRSCNSRKGARTPVEAGMPLRLIGGGASMAWIESHQSLSRHRKTIRASGLLQVDRHKLIGHLHELWWWGLDNVGVDGRLGDMTPGEVAMAAEWDGDEEVFVNALVEAGFLDREDGGLYLHDWKGPGVNAVDVEVMRRKWEAMSPRVRPQILDRDNYTCQACGETEGPLEIDHIVPIARGGTNKPSNLQVLCRPCNRRKGTDIWPG